MNFCDICQVEERGANCEKCSNFHSTSLTGRVFWQSSKPIGIINHFRQERLIPPDAQVVVGEIKWKSSPKRLIRQVRQVFREYDTLFFENLPQKVLNVMSIQPGFNGKVLMPKK